MSKEIFPIISDKQTITNRVYPKSSTLLVVGLMLSSCLTASLQALPGDEEGTRSSAISKPPKKRHRSDSLPNAASSAAKDDGRHKRHKPSAESSLQAQNELESPALTRDARVKKAIAVYTAALDMRDANGQAVCTGQKRALALHNRGFVYTLQSQWGPAIADYTAALDMQDANGQAVLTGQNRAMTLFSRGIGYARQSQWTPAIADFTAALDMRDANEQAIQTRTKRASTLFNRGDAYINLRQWAPAVADFTMALDMRDDSGNFLLGEGAEKRLLLNRAEAYRQLANQDVLKSNNIK